MRDWAALDLLGTTFSGHSFRTTIGNSCDSFIFLLVAKYLGTGNMDSEDSRWKPLVQGDDVIVNGQPDFLSCLAKGYQEISHHEKYSPIPKGLGQVLKESSITQLEGASFCSKTFSKENGGVCVPDIRKALTTKVFYRGSEAEIHSQPKIHA